MNDQLDELYAGSAPTDEPPLRPGYLVSTLAAARGARRRRRVRNAVVGGVAVATALALSGVMIQQRLGSTPQPTAASPGQLAASPAGSFDPLVQRLKPGWLPAGYNLSEQGTENLVQSLRFEKWVATGKKSQPEWSVNLYLYPPGVGPASDGPLEKIRFGSGKKADPVQGMPAELLNDVNGYTLAWRYPSGAHAVVTLANAGTGSGTGFGDRTESVARRVADKLRIDGATPLLYPFSLRLPKGQHVIATSVRRQHLPGDPFYTDALVTFSPGPKMSSWSTVELQSRPDKGEPTSTEHGRNYLDPNFHGFLLQVNVPHGQARTLVDRVHVFGKPTDLDTWRPNPVA